MALPTTNLRLHLDASDTDNLFTTSGNPPTGTPSDGSAISVWRSEADSAITTDFYHNAAGGTTLPLWRSTSPLMRLPCLDFDGTNDDLWAWTAGQGGGRALSDYMTNAAFTVAIAFYPESITNTAANARDNHQIFGDTQGVWGMTLKDVSGTKKLRCFNFDSNEDVIEATVATSRTWIAVYRHDSGNLKLTVIDDTGTETNPTDVASGNTADLTHNLRMGMSNVFVTVFYNGRIGEIAFYNSALSGTALTDLKDYFVAKWLGIGGGGAPVMVVGSAFESSAFRSRAFGGVVLR